MLHKRNGILPEALLNFIVRLGWRHGNDEVISREQMIAVVRLRPRGQHLRRVEPGEAALAEPAVAEDAARGGRGAAAGAVPRRARSARRRTTRGCRAWWSRSASGAKTLVEMAELARPLLQSGRELDEKAAAKHLDDADEARCSGSRARRSPRCRRGRPGGSTGAQGAVASRQAWAWGRWPSRCGWPSPARPSARAIGRDAAAARASDEALAPDRRGAAASTREAPWLVLTPPGPLSIGRARLWAGYGRARCVLLTGGVGAGGVRSTACSCPTGRTEGRRASVPVSAGLRRAR